MLALIVTSGLTVALGLLGFGVAAFIDSNDNVRAEKLECTDSVLALRDSLITLKRGYDVDPGEKPTRLADWDSVRFAVDRTTFTCRSSLSSSKVVTDSYNDVKFALNRDLTVAYQGHWDGTDTIDAIQWTGVALKYLSAD